jgi:hypothetical protein
MYHDTTHINDELRRDLAQADQKAAYGWRVWTMQSREFRWLDAALAFLGRTLIAAGQWLATGRDERMPRGQFGLTGAA